MKFSPSILGENPPLFLETPKYMAGKQKLQRNEILVGGFNPFEKY